MTNDIYGIRDLLKEYPLVEDVFIRAEESIATAFFAMGGEAAALAGPKLIMEMIDQNIDGTDAEKQALIIGVMYSMSFTSLKEDVGSLGTKYGPEVRAVVEDILNDEKNLAGNQNSVAPESVSRVSAVLCICSMSSFAAVLSAAGNAARTTPQLAQKMKDSILTQENQFLPALNAPRLKAFYQQKKQDLFAVLDKAAQPQNGKKPGGWNIHP